MTDTEYTPDEIRLLDEFARAALGAMVNESTNGHTAKWSYEAAAAMIAERRKRVPQPQPNAFYYMGQPIGRADQFGTSPVAPLTVGAHVAPLTVGITPSPTTTVTTAPVAQPESRVTDPAQDLIDQWDAQPETEKGELTEEAVANWRAEASDTPIKGAPVGVFRIGDDEIDRAVALMREGLRAKQTAEVLRHKVADLQRTVEQGADDLRAADESITMAKRERDDWKKACEVASRWDADKAGRLEQVTKERDEARAEVERLRDEAAAWHNLRPVARDCESECQQLRARAEKAEAALAEAQPVLDAVVTYCWDTHGKAILARELLAAYADRRSEQGKGAS